MADMSQTASPLSAGRRRQVLRQGISVGVASGVYGVSFGALGVTSGLSVVQTQALSLLMFTGASQFAFVGVIAAGGAGSAAIATATLLGLRNGLYGLQVGPMLGVHGARRLLAAQLTIDESTAVGLAQTEPAARRFGFWAAGWSVFVLWNLSTLVGAVLGNSLGDARRWGLDGAAVAAFLALLWPRLHSREGWSVAAAGAAVAILASPHVPPGIPVILAGLVAVVAGLLPRSWRRGSL
jgi:predicted branched-subunit amino acid permease